jgi:hypothetical protein
MSYYLSLPISAIGFVLSVICQAFLAGWDAGAFWLENQVIKGTDAERDL